jgi:glycosyltransferase involved in cell wall biosynthesis
MIGRNQGMVTTQGEILCDLLREAGFPVTSISDSPNRYLRAADILITLLRRPGRAAIVVLQVFSGPSFIIEDAASWISELSGQRIVMFLHGGAMPAFMASHPRWIKRVLGRAQAIVAPSEYLANAVRKYGFQAQIIPNVIDLSTYKHRQRTQLRPSIFWMRSFHEIYNPEMAVRVLSQVRSFVPEARLTMAGPDKGKEADVRRLAECLGLNGSVRFTGFLDMRGKLREGNSSDIYINTNHVDNMPVGVLEACAMGLPVVSTNVGGIPYLLKDGETGLLVEDNNVEAMAAAIIRLLRDENLASRLSTNGRLLAEKSSWEVVRPQWEDLLQRVMN